MILYSVSMRTDIVSLFSFFPFFSIEITLLSQLFFSFQLNDGPTTCKVHLRERKCTLFLDHTRDKFLHLFFNPQYSRRLAVHKQIFLNLLRQNGRRVTKVY